MKKKLGLLIIILLLAVAAAGGFIMYKYVGGGPAKNSAKEPGATETDMQITEALDRGVSDAEFYAHRAAGSFLPQERVYSHGHTEAADEHSFASYDRNIEEGSHYVDLDIVFSADGTLYVSHDLTAARLIGDGRYYSDMTDVQIDKLRTYNGEPVLKLSDVFDRYKDKVHYLIEIKDDSDAVMDAFRKVVDEYDMAGHVDLQSKYANVLHKGEEIYPEMRKIRIVKTQDVFNEALSDDVTDELSVRINYMSASNCKAVHDAGKRFSVWTLNTEDGIREAIDIGADAYFTNDTALALDLERRYRKDPYGPETSVFAASDYQAEAGFDDPEDTLRGLLESVSEDGRQPEISVFCGDYTNDAKLHDYQLSPDESIAEIKDVIEEEAPLVEDGDMLFVQGNHDKMTDALSESGLHEFDDCLVYVVNTESDFPWKQGKAGGSRAKVRAAAAKMKECFDGLIAAGEKRPVIIAGHVPLHYTARTSSKHSTGDNLYSSLIFDTVNEAASKLDIIYLFGHNHSKGWDCYMGGGSVMKQPGDTLLLPVIGKGTYTDSFEEKTLKFTYMNAGYTGYYMNCSPGQYKNGGEGYHSADETLTGSVIDIYADRIVITRYDEDGPHDAGAAGSADPYMGGVDEDLIGDEYYSDATAGPVVIRRSVN